MMPYTETFAITNTASIPLKVEIPSGNFQGYENALKTQNRSVNLITPTFYYIQTSESVIPGWIVYNGNNPLQEYIYSFQHKPKISLSVAHKLAVKVMKDAEKRREHERDLEAIFWESLEGVE
jgi:hypothetical protein